MSALQLLSYRRGAKSRPAGIVLLLVALASAGLVGALNGHACTGDDCVLCLVAACAHMLLTVSLVAALACPIVRIVSQMRTVRIVPRLRLELMSSALVDARSERVEMTPVTLGVRLII